MKILKFTGYSDDTFGEETSKIDYDNCAGGTPIQFDVKAPDGSGICVTGCYCSEVDEKILGNGCWMIGVEALDETKPVDWKITLNPSFDDYRGLLEVEVPDDVEVTLKQKNN